MAQKDHNHHDHHECNTESGSGVRQTLSEMDFERGIWYAAQTNDLKRVEILLKKGTTASEEDSAGYTALHYAARAGNFDICKLLLENGAKVNAVTRCGRATALHRAAMMGNEKIVKLLLDFGADCNIQDDDGYTALHRAVLCSSQAVWDLLVKKTDSNLVDNNGNSTRELAIQKKNIIIN